MSLSMIDTDEHGFVRGFALHDARLLALVHDEESARLDVRFRQVDDRVATVTLRGVGALGIVGFRNGLILSHLFVWPGDVPLSKGPTVRTAWEALFGGDLAQESLPRAIGRFARESPLRHLAYMSSAYGGSIAAVFSEFEIAIHP